ncbi:MAG: bifunctional UDP-N-acetylglucosamine diphosphorylase/glucosamine-1-phosphate N-acetyltransferase GlmU [Myxococcaceae bacterium]
MPSTPLAAVVLCAGQGTRMKSEKAKVLHSLLGRPLCWYPVTRALELGASKVVAVVGHQAEAVTSALREAFPDAPLEFALQAEQKGTAHAVRCAEGVLSRSSGRVLILYGDVPLLREETLKELVSAYRAGKGPLAMLTTRPDDPTGYGRVVRQGGQVSRIVEHKDATPEERGIDEVNAGIYLVDSAFLWRSLGEIRPANAQGEYYLTDLVERAAGQGGVATVSAAPEETAGVNDRAELAARAKVLRMRINSEYMRLGVTLQHPETTFIDQGVEIGPNTVIGPMVSIHAGCEIGANVKLGQGSVLMRTTIGDGTEVKPYSVFEEAVVGPGCVIGPFARLRPGTVLDEGVHLGNFVETKKTRIKKGSKANHLAYLGDAEIGAGVNVGAGTITCNYDGVHKHKTVLGDGVFVGSDTQLVAPVTIGAGAYIGAGSTITKDVPPDALAISRVPQKIKEGWAAQKRAKQRK